MRATRFARLSMAAFVAVAALAACQPRRQPPQTVRLFDAYRPELLHGAPPSPRPRPRTEWIFSASDDAPGPHRATRGWSAASGVSGLAVRDGRLMGTSTTDFPLLHVERTTGLKDKDLLHEVQVRLRASAGANVAISFSRDEKLDANRLIDMGRTFSWPARTPLIAGEELRTYVLRPRRGTPSSQVRHLAVIPTDRKGARFEIESVRLVFRKEHLAAVGSGPGWQGLSEVYRETLVSRTPETIRYELDLLEGPWLDLAVGTPEDSPVTFRVAVADGGREEAVFERTVTTPDRWEDARVDLSRFGGRKVSLALSVTADEPGTLGFWGAPSVRSPQPAVERAGAAPPQGVIIVWVDTLRRDHLDAYGYGRPTAPTLKRLASEGTLFRDCVVQGTWTKVSTPSLLTALYPASHGVHDFSDRLPAAADTLAEAYRAGGHRTLSMSSVIFVGRFTNLHQGFEELHEDTSLPDQESSKTARVYTDRLLSWLEARKDAPFFVLFHVTDPHDPYRPAAPYDGMWADPARADEHEKAARDARRFISDPLLKLFGMPTRAELTKAGVDAEAYVQHDRDWYDGSIRALDAELGRVMERLRTLGLDRKTLVVFTADHGEEFLEHGRMFHGQSAYGELANVPLVLWGPGLIPAGRVVEETVETIDLMPTLLELSGLQAPRGMQGRSLTPFLAGEGRAPSGWASKPAITEKAAIKETGGPPPRDTEHYAISIDGWKLVHHVQRPAGGPEYELFDRRQDPLDLHDLAAKRPDMVQKLSRQLVAWRKAADGARLPPDAEASRSMSAEELERLRSLGYIQ